MVDAASLYEIQEARKERIGELYRSFLVTDEPFGVKMGAKAKERLRYWAGIYPRDFDRIALLMYKESDKTKWKFHAETLMTKLDTMVNGASADAAKRAKKPGAASPSGPKIASSTFSVPSEDGLRMFAEAYASFMSSKTQSAVQASAPSRLPLTKITDSNPTGASNADHSGDDTEEEGEENPQTNLPQLPTTSAPLQLSSAATSAFTPTSLSALLRKGKRTKAEQDQASPSLSVSSLYGSILRVTISTQTGGYGTHFHWHMDPPENRMTIFALLEPHSFPSLSSKQFSNQFKLLISSAPLDEAWARSLAGTKFENDAVCVSSLSESRDLTYFVTLPGNSKIMSVTRANQIQNPTGFTTWIWDVTVEDLPQLAFFNSPPKSIFA